MKPSTPPRIARVSHTEQESGSDDDALQDVERIWKSWERCVFVKKESVVKREVSKSDVLRLPNGKIIHPSWPQGLSGPCDKTASLRATFTAGNNRSEPHTNRQQVEELKEVWELFSIRSPRLYIEPKWSAMANPYAQTFTLTYVESAEYPHLNAFLNPTVSQCFVELLARMESAKPHVDFKLNLDQGIAYGGVQYSSYCLSMEYCSDLGEFQIELAHYIGSSFGADASFQFLVLIRPTLIEWINIVRGQYRPSPGEHRSDLTWPCSILSKPIR